MYVKHTKLRLKLELFIQTFIKLCLRTFLYKNKMINISIEMLLYFYILNLLSKSLTMLFFFFFIKLYN